MNPARESQGSPIDPVFIEWSDVQIGSDPGRKRLQGADPAGSTAGSTSRCLAGVAAQNAWLVERAPLIETARSMTIALPVAEGAIGRFVDAVRDCPFFLAAGGLVTDDHRDRHQPGEAPAGDPPLAPALAGRPQTRRTWRPTGRTTRKVCPRHGFGSAVDSNSAVQHRRLQGLSFRRCIVIPLRKAVPDPPDFPDDSCVDRPPPCRP